MPDAAPPPAATHAETRARLVEIIALITRQDPPAVSDATPCVGAGLLGDSLDVLEFVVSLQREFGVSIRDSDAGRTVLTDLGTLTRYVMEHRSK